MDLLRFGGPSVRGGLHPVYADLMAVPETYVILKSKLGVVLAGLAAVAAMDAAAYVKNAQVPELLAKCPIAVRYGFWLLAAVLIFVFGAYGTGYNAGNFIYSQF